MNDADPRPGWFGKLPATGDFASRRLPPPFIALWDDWLQQAMAGSQAALGERWLDSYLGTPIWHFALGPGVCGDACWAGVLMPSVDKVGRYFPLTLASAMPRLPASAAQMNMVLDWLEGIENIALTTLDASATLERLEEELFAAPFPAWETADSASLGSRLAGSLAAGAPSAFTLDSFDSVLPLLTDTAAALLTGACRQRSLWWSGTTARNHALLLCASGLPSVTQFVRMLSMNSGDGEAD